MPEMMISSTDKDSKAPIEAVRVEYPPVAKVVMACASASKPGMPAIISITIQTNVRRV